MQLRDLLPLALVGKLYPEAVKEEQSEGQANVQVSSLSIYGGEPFSQVRVSARVISGHEPTLFEIEVTIAGIFEQTGPLPAGYTRESYLGATSLTLLLPFLRESVFDMAMRLRIGPILLPIVVPGAASAPEQPSPAAPDDAAPRRPADGARPDGGPTTRRRPPRQSPSSS